MADYSRLLGSASEAIGNTPLIALNRITREVDGRILAKLEMLNPGFSKKDRPALQIIEDAEANGSRGIRYDVRDFHESMLGRGAMPLEYFQPDTTDQEVIVALERDGACVVLNQAPAEIIDAVNVDFRAPFDELGRFDEDDFHGYKTRRISSILCISHAAADLVEWPRLIPKRSSASWATAGTPVRTAPLAPGKTRTAPGWIFEGSAPGQLFQHFLVT